MVVLLCRIILSLVHASDDDVAAMLTVVLVAVKEFLNDSSFNCLNVYWEMTL
jgi:hypothetical protein